MGRGAVRSDTRGEGKGGRIDGHDDEGLGRDGRTDGWTDGRSTVNIHAENPRRIRTCCD